MFSREDLSCISELGRVNELPAGGLNYIIITCLSYHWNLFLNWTLQEEPGDILSL